MRNVHELFAENEASDVGQQPNDGEATVLIKMKILAFGHHSKLFLWKKFIAYVSVHCSLELDPCRWWLDAAIARDAIDFAFSILFFARNKNRKLLLERKTSGKRRKALTSDFGTTFSLEFRTDWVRRQHRFDRQPISTFDNEICAPKMPTANEWTLCDVFEAFGRLWACENRFCSNCVHLWSFHRHHGNVHRWHRYTLWRTIVCDNRWNRNRTMNGLRCRCWCSRPGHRCFGDLRVVCVFECVARMYKLN